MLFNLFPLKKSTKPSMFSANRQDYNMLNNINISSPDITVYDNMIQSIPIISAGVHKIIRLIGEFEVICDSPNQQNQINQFINTVKVGGSSTGIRQFILTYLYDMLVYGNAVGEIIPTDNGVEYLYNVPLQDFSMSNDQNLFIPNFFKINNHTLTPIQYPEYILFTPLNPKSGQLLGNSILKDCTSIAESLAQVFRAIGKSFQRLGDLRYAVTYHPNQNVDSLEAKDIATDMSNQWSNVMNSNSSTSIKDFIAVGDVDIKVIGADNNFIDTATPVRQLNEQIIARLGLPPFILGLNWSTSERMSKQQADILISEINNYRRLISPVIQKICETHLILCGQFNNVKISWNNINLQDEVELARAKLISAQADKILRNGSNANLTLINSFTRRELSQDQVFSFDFILCDNDVDRDLEKFSDNALEKISDMFVGITGVFDHNPSSHNQQARIFKSELITDPLIKNSLGQPYKSVKASAYMVRTSSNADLISEIDAGIKKEVSIGCKVDKKSCSICSKISCSHKKGQLYNNNLCYHLLDNVSDAYEWSFVAVPAQKNAGITKKFSTLTTTHSQNISNFSTHTIQLAQIGKNQLDIIKKDIFKSIFHSCSNSNMQIISNIMDTLDFNELCALKSILSTNTTKPFPSSQFCPKSQLTNTTNNNFKI